MNPLDISISPVGISQIKDLQKIAIDSFYETFSDINSEEDMNQYLDDCFNENQLSRELNNQDSLFYFAYDKSEVIGYLKINLNLAQTEQKHLDWVEIERIYVLKQYHGKQVGQLLLEKGFEISIARKAPFIWLGVWEFNDRAISFYNKNGFSSFDKHVFMLGSDKQTDILLKKEIK